MMHRKLGTFTSDFAKLAKEIQVAAVEAFKLFETNPSHPSLQIEKLPGTGGIWSGRVTKHYRWTFHYETDKVTGARVCVHRRIGTHDAVYESP